MVWVPAVVTVVGVVLVILGLLTRQRFLRRIRALDEEMAQFRGFVREEISRGHDVVPRMESSGEAPN